jgi:hypothetical protein
VPLVPPYIISPDEVIGDNALNAAFAVVAPVPPLATEIVPEILLALIVDETVGIFKVVPDSVAAPIPDVVNVNGA